MEMRWKPGIHIQYKEENTFALLLDKNVFILYIKYRYVEL